MSNMLTLTGRPLAGGRCAAAATREHLARLPDHLLHDMGLSPNGFASIARQLRGR